MPFLAMLIISSHPALEEESEWLVWHDEFKRLPDLISIAANNPRKMKHFCSTEELLSTATRSARILYNDSLRKKSLRIYFPCMFLDINRLGTLSHRKRGNSHSISVETELKLPICSLSTWGKPSGSVFKECFLKRNLGENH